MLEWKDLKDGQDYMATATDGKKYKGTYVNKYLPGGVFYTIMPEYTPDGRKNELVSFEEA